MADANFLRERAAHYRRLAECETDGNEAETFRRLAEAFEAEALTLARGRSDARQPVASPGMGQAD